MYYFACRTFRRRFFHSVSSGLLPAIVPLRPDRRVTRGASSGSLGTTKSQPGPRADPWRHSRMVFKATVIKKLRYHTQRIVNIVNKGQTKLVCRKRARLGNQDESSRINPIQQVRLLYHSLLGRSVLDSSSHQFFSVLSRLGFAIDLGSPYLTCPEKN